MSAPARRAGAPRTRRAFIVQGARLIGGVAIAPLAVDAALGGLRRDEPLAAKCGSPRTPVVSFRLDRLYLDPTGGDTPYLAPAGTRSAQSVATIRVSGPRPDLGWT